MPPEQLRESLELLRASSTARPIGVDRKANVLRGYVVAQLGPFKSPGRGEFDQTSLDMIIELGNAAKQGLKSRFSHPTECDDGLGKHLGRTRDLFMSEATNRDGVKVPAVRGDLHFDATAMDEPPGGGKPLGLYVMDLAESDPDALSSSLVLRVKTELRLNPDGTKKKDEKGEDLPPLWRPFKLWASDVVDTGDAVDGLLSAEGLTDGLPNGVLWTATEMLDSMFDGLTREQVADRLRGFTERYLTMRFGPKESKQADGNSGSLDTVNRKVLDNLFAGQEARVQEWLDGKVIDKPLGVFEVPKSPPAPAAPEAAQSSQPSLLILLLRQRQRELEALA